MASRKDQRLSAIFLIYSIFRNRNQMSLFSHKTYDKLITMTGKKSGVPVLIGELQPFFNWQSSISRQIRHVFNVRVHKRVLNDAVNYAQKGCAMQLWGITLRWNSNSICHIVAKHSEWILLYTKIWLINGVDNVNWPPHRDWIADQFRALALRQSE